MPQSLSKNYIHLVFSTHGRADMIPKDRMGEVFSYISAVLTDKGCPTLCVNGTQNHVHILFILSRNTALADAVRLAKNNTSKWSKIIMSPRWGYKNILITSQTGLTPCPL